ncbi:branched-chain amino acid ABC transporter substrate-binding protein [Aquisalimonas asiatica]|uniref:Branched-chain amino acid transport system substrate-binding protein n=1 Tax=Aquisalimonas asiatica TaxID=406100 RepID=A0A1H8TXI9_9GAMM|nr:branched-chain amino acid ABC transporter substrate-binding protein [Aquisalimonas asiatica]SEO95575.1 branched-chain amino acid transport system substrate-binding protein [Aquisalimonas asiatica]
MTKPRRTTGLFAGLATAGAIALASLSTAQAEDPIRIAYIDPLSGPFANVGDAGLKHFRFAADRINDEGGINGRPVEIVPMDNNQSASESAQLVQRAADRGIDFVTQGNGSDVAGAIIETVNRNNRRNPDNKLLYLNYAAVDPSLTNERCSYWHFRFDADTTIKLEALTNYMMERDDIEKVYLLNQDYSHGHQIERRFEELAAEKMPNVEIVGKQLHPIGQVRDFSPYVSRIRQSGADSVVTGNWGNDLSLLAREAEDAGLDVNFYTYYAGGLGVPAAVGRAGIDRVAQITEWHANVNVDEGHDEYREWVDAFKERYPDIDWYYHRVYNLMYMLKAAVEEAGSTDAEAVAAALSGMEFESHTGTVTMREDDHQMLQPMYISIMDDDVEYDAENSGVGFRTLSRIEVEDATSTTSCEMNRP